MGSFKSLILPVVNKVFSKRINVNVFRRIISRYCNSFEAINYPRTKLCFYGSCDLKEEEIQTFLQLKIKQNAVFHPKRALIMRWNASRARTSYIFIASIINELCGNAAAWRAFPTFQDAGARAG